MRLDLFLKKVLIIKRRTLSQELIKSGRVFVNGSIAKPGKDIKEGDIIIFPLRKKKLTIKVKQIPKGNVKKGDELNYYEVLKEENIDE
ncbi:RNA-binding S4 domain protein [Thermotomaculum hydrothermale]|uniref:RNA-binding S4 domain protein n=1 Tax=Thermotomaculum hydrothermale TaxID=981385 RepID=A0A7R6SXN7_9BACT|nr:S4 domain-containing protein [Thermotomaculum hydrothermale]BBB31696.1 RNA-binding S4 domain protein [Thermotomaculum hydrothermale]